VSPACRLVTYLTSDRTPTSRIPACVQVIMCRSGLPGYAKPGLHRFVSDRAITSLALGLVQPLVCGPSKMSPLLAALGKIASFRPPVCHHIHTKIRNENP
jgi:hypothetical protein